METLDVCDCGSRWHDVSCPSYRLTAMFQTIGAAVEKRREREQIEWVLGLTGGEMDRDPCYYQTDERSAERSHAYSYDGVPEWAESDFEDLHDSGVQYCTLIDIACIYGEMPGMIRIAGEWWAKVATYTHSGEADCPCGPSGSGEKHVGDDPDVMGGHAECWLCEASAGEEHGYVYVSDIAEVVYRHVDPVCAECGDDQKECERYPSIAGVKMCRCADDLAENIADGVNAMLDWCEAN